jgi:hypothetical protein
MQLHTLANVRQGNIKLVLQLLDTARNQLRSTTVTQVISFAILFLQIHGADRSVTLSLLV